MTEPELTAIRARLAAVPAGPWWVDAGGPDETCDLVSADNREIASFPFYAPFRNRGVEEFVAHAPTDIALLLSEVDRLRAELAEALATLANERGEGEPPDPSFNWRAGRWVSDTLGVQIMLGGRGWHVEDLWYDAHVQHSESAYSSARAAMIAASAAKGGAR